MFFQVFYFAYNASQNNYITSGAQSRLHVHHGDNHDHRTHGDPDNEHVHTLYNGDTFAHLCIQPHKRLRI